MKVFTVLNPSGKAIRTGSCPDEAFELQADQSLGETVVEGVVPFDPVEEVFTWRGNRMREYPPLQQLADALYWSQKGNPVLLDAYLAACEEVKRKYPKE